MKNMGFGKGFAIGFGATMGSYLLGEALINGGKEIVDAQRAKEKTESEAIAEAEYQKYLKREQINKEVLDRCRANSENKTLPKKDPELDRALAIFNDVMALPDNGFEPEI